jgi:hypothetical protein
MCRKIRCDEKSWKVFLFFGWTKQELCLSLSAIILIAAPVPVKAQALDWYTVYNYICACRTVTYSAQPLWLFICDRAIALIPSSQCPAGWRQISNFSNCAWPHPHEILACASNFELVDYRGIEHWHARSSQILLASNSNSLYGIAYTNAYCCLLVNCDLQGVQRYEARDI